MLYLGLKLFNVGLEVVVLFNGWLVWDVVGEGGNLRYAFIAKQIAAASLLVFAHVKKFFIVTIKFFSGHKIFDVIYIMRWY